MWKTHGYFCDDDDDPVSSHWMQVVFWSINFGSDFNGVGASKRKNTSFARLLGTRGAFGGKDKFQRSDNELLR